MHWMDVLREPGLRETTVISFGDVKAFGMVLWLEDFAVPSWNRLLAMHEMTRMRCRKLIHNIVCEQISGRNVSRLCRLEYDAINRPTKAKKHDLKALRVAETPEHRRLKRFMEKGFERPRITERPEEFNGALGISMLHHRRRLIDIDNLSVKAVIDSLVEIGLLPTDSPECVKSVQIAQNKIDSDQAEAIEIRMLEIPDGLKGPGFQ